AGLEVRVVLLHAGDQVLGVAALDRRAELAGGGDELPRGPAGHLGEVDAREAVVEVGGELGLPRARELALGDAHAQARDLSGLLAPAGDVEETLGELQGAGGGAR